MKKICLVFLCFLCFGCSKSKEEQKLICSGTAKVCTYKAVADSTIGEEEYLCDDEYGDTSITFIYKEEDRWDSAYFVTTYFEDKSTDENYDIALSNCINNCKVYKKDDKIVVSEKYSSDKFQNGNIEKVKKYMSDLGYTCK
jgi:hypothetical protein